MGNADQLLDYINKFGLIACNKDSYIKSLDDIGCSWQDAVALIDDRKIFYSKIYKHKTVYLSIRLYSLLKKFNTGIIVNENSRLIYNILENNPPQNTDMLKTVSQLNKNEFKKAQLELLEQLHMTAISSYKSININWSSFYYTTSSNWEKSIKFEEADCTMEEAKEEIFILLGKTMKSSEIEKLIS
jgi:hypothetical protein